MEGIAVKVCDANWKNQFLLSSFNASNFNLSIPISFVILLGDMTKYANSFWL